MADEVALSAAVRSSLLSLKNTTKLIERTQGRLSTGLQVASAVDDAVAFFQAKALSDRASDFSEKKDGIDQGISTVTAGLNAVEGVENLVQQLKGLGQALKSATSAQFTDLVGQFNDLRTQIDLLTADATYQGINLVNGTGQTLEVEFSNKSDSFLRVESFDLTVKGLGVGEAVIAATGNSIIELNADTAGLAFAANANLSAVSAFSEFTGGVEFTYRGPDDTFTAGTVYELTLGTTVFEFELGTDATITQGAVVSAGLEGATGVGSVYDGNAATGVTGFTLVYSAGLAELQGDSSAKTIGNDYNANYLREADTDQINLAIDQLDGALTTLRGNAATLGSNVALLKTRLEFTEDYVNTLEAGAGKLTLADINEEGANLLALQTRQQLGISALSFAGQAEQAILALFR